VSETAILKLHGSLNWYSCRNCDSYTVAEAEDVIDIFDRGLYPVISICSTCQATAQQLIVPPIAQKYQEHPILLDIRRRAEDAFLNARAIVVGGYSFTEADEYIMRMLSRAVRADRDKVIVVLDMKLAPHSRLSRFLETHARTFETRNRLLPIVGDIVNVGPPLVEQLARAFPVEVQRSGVSAVERVATSSASQQGDAAADAVRRS
jgi:hypothetical protein